VLGQDGRFSAAPKPIRHSDTPARIRAVRRFDVSEAVGNVGWDMGRVLTERDLVDVDDAVLLDVRRAAPPTVRLDRRR
jgi:hypothetical protein